MQQEFVCSDNVTGSRPTWAAPQYQLAGVDTEGAHHLLRNTVDRHTTILVIADGTITQRYNLHEMGKTLDEWKAYVAHERGWASWFITPPPLDFSVIADQMEGGA